MSKVYCITGSSSGIGEYLADYFQTDPTARVIRLSRKDCEFDVTKPPFQIMHDRIDVLINCAGIAAMNHSTLISPAKALEIVNTNLVGTHNMCQAVFPKMRKHGGRIINFSSIAAHLAIEGEGIYAASKAGVECLTRVLAKDYSAWDITVNCIAPGPVDTKLIRSVPMEKIKKILDRQANKRMCSMEDILNVVQFFIRDESNMVTGQTIVMGGV